MPSRFFGILFLLSLWSGIPALAQRLLWEQAVLHTPANLAGNSESFSAAYKSPTASYFTVKGGYFVTRGNTCLPQVRYYYQNYSLTGTLLKETPIVGGNLAESCQVAAAAGGGSWWPGVGYFCIGNVQHPRAYVQRLSVLGDTIRSYWLAPAALPRTSAKAVLTRGATVLVAGYVKPIGQVQQIWQYSLTCLDTLTGQIRWQQAYPRQPLANDYPSALVQTPRGGYLISGDGTVGGGFQHYLAETDSLGSLLRQRLYLPLGPTITGGDRYTNNCNVLVLPNAQGYLLSGSVDSMMSSKNIGYVMRLDTALNVQWVYRNPPRTNGNLNRSQYAYKIRFLPNNTVGVLLTDISTTAPDTYLVQLDITTGQRVAPIYTMSSNTQRTVTPYDWQWLGDGTLLLAGTSTQVGVTGKQAYLARWDFRNTPLAARSAAVARATATFYAFPNPAAGPLTFRWQLAAGQRAGAVRLYSVLGQLVREVPLPPVSEGQQELAGLAPGLYVARLLDAQGNGQGSAVRLVVE